MKLFIRRFIRKHPTFIPICAILSVEFLCADLVIDSISYAVWNGYINKVVGVLLLFCQYSGILFMYKFNKILNAELDKIYE